MFITTKTHNYRSTLDPPLSSWSTTTKTCTIKNASQVRTCCLVLTGHSTEKLCRTRRPRTITVRCLSVRPSESATRPTYILKPPATETNTTGRLLDCWHTHIWLRLNIALGPKCQPLTPKAQAVESKVAFDRTNAATIGEQRWWWQQWKKTRPVIV